MKDILNSSRIYAQLIRYFGVALIGLAIDFSTVIFAKEVLNLHYLVAVCCGFILGLIVIYVLSNLVVFGKPKSSARTAFLLFGLIGLVGLGILNLLMWLLTGQLGVNYIIAKVVATIFVFSWNFIARRALYDNSPQAP
jgi:putative flippase GtrA